METTQNDDLRMDEASQVMSRIVDMAVQKFQKQKIKPSADILQGLMTESLNEIQSSFGSRAELSEWHTKAMRREEGRIQAKIDGWLAKGK